MPAIDQKIVFTIDPLSVKVKEELPRIRQELGEIEKLAMSIKKFGQMQPILINRNNELIAGGRRLAACIVADIHPIACYSDTVDPLTMREMELEENVQRKALTPAEEVLAVAELHKLKQEIYGEAVGGQTKSGEVQGWGTKDTADLVGKTKGAISQDLALAEAIKNFPSLATCKTKGEIKSAVRGLEKAAQQIDGLRKYEETIKMAKEFVLVNRDFVSHISGIGDNTVDLILTDPPYGIDIFDVAIGTGGETGAEHTTTGFKYEDSEEYAKSMLTVLAKESFRITKPTGHAYVFCAPSMFSWLVHEMLNAGWDVRERPIIWIKRETGQNNAPHCWPSSAYEFILFARKAEARLILEGKPDWIQADPVSLSEKVHQAEKPVNLLKDLMSRTCFPGQFVYDGFMGSGSTIEAAAELKLLGIGCDNSIEAYAAAVNRMAKWSEKQVKLARTDGGV